MAQWQPGEYCSVRDNEINKNCNIVGFSGYVTYVGNGLISFYVHNYHRSIKGHCSIEQFTSCFRKGIAMPIATGYIASRHYPMRFPQDFFVKK